MTTAGILRAAALAAAITGISTAAEADVCAWWNGKRNVLVQIGITTQDGKQDLTCLGQVSQQGGNVLIVSLQATWSPDEPYSCRKKDGAVIAGNVYFDFRFGANCSYSLNQARMSLPALSRRGYDSYLASSVDGPLIVGSTSDQSWVIRMSPWRE